VDTRKATALMAASVLTVAAGGISLAVDLGLFHTAGAAALTRPATVTKTTGSPKIVKVYRDVIDPPSALATGTAKTHAVQQPGHPAVSTLSPQHRSDDPSTSVSTTTVAGSTCTEEPDSDDHASGDDHAEPDDSGEKGPATSSTTAATSAPAAKSSASCDDSTSADPDDDAGTMTPSSAPSSAPPSGHEDR
jgi:hypothetical protein